MSTPSLHVRSLGLLALFVFASLIPACGARSVMLSRPGEYDPIVEDGTGGANGIFTTPSSGSGGLMLPSGGRGATETGGTGGTLSSAAATGGSGGRSAETGGTGGGLLSSGGSGGEGTMTAGTSGGRSQAGGNSGGGTGGAAGRTTSRGGAGGSTMATGGAGGLTSATGGTGGGVLGKCTYVSCLWDLIRDCNAAAPCVQDTSGAQRTSATVKKCCENGVTETIVASFLPSGMVSGTMSATRAGEKCYDMDMSLSLDGSSGTFYWRNVSGEVVAKGRLVGKGGATEISCPNGDTQTLPPTCNPDGSDDPKVQEGKCP